MASQTTVTSRVPQARMLDSRYQLLRSFSQYDGTLTAALFSILFWCDVRLLVLAGPCSVWLPRGLRELFCRRGPRCCMFWAVDASCWWSLPFLVPGGIVAEASAVYGRWCKRRSGGEACGVNDGGGGVGPTLVMGVLLSPRVLCDVACVD